MEGSDYERQLASDGTALLGALSALANPHRLRIIAALGSSRQYVSQLARDLHMSRPLLHMHLRKLEAAGLVTGSMELSDDGKAMKFFEVAPFAVNLTPELIIEAARTLGGDDEPASKDAPEEHA